MKSILLVLIFLLGVVRTYGQNPDFDEDAVVSPIEYGWPTSPLVSCYWSSLPTSPIAVSRSCCAYVIIGGTPYLYQFGGGGSSSELRRVARLNLVTNTWQNNYSTMPHQISSGTAIAMNNDSIIYVFGGNNGPGVLGRTLRYNVYTNSWQTMADMPTRVTDALVVKYSNSTIFVVGGGDGFFGANAFVTNAVQSYNINTNTYTYRNNFPISCAMQGGGIYRDTIISVGGYTTGGNAISNCYKGVINPSTLNITWTAIAPYPSGAILRLATFVAVKDQGVGIMCSGGSIGGSVPTASTHMWNFCTQSWLPGLPNNTLARSNYKASGRGGNIIYSAGGYTNTGVGTTERVTFDLIDGPCQNMVGINNNENGIPEGFVLNQNYPNPFNPETKISFSLPEASFVKMLVTDITGKEVKTLLNKLYTAGNHSIGFNAENLPSGVYFYTITAGEFKDTKKMLLVK